MEEYKFYKSYYLYSKRHDVFVSNYGNVKDNDKIKHNPSKVLGERIYIVVANLFLPNPENKPQVDHIDTNRKNNRVDNLRWVTNEENMHNEITKQHCSEAAKLRHQKGVYNYSHLKGKTPWNKGLSKETDERVRQGGLNSVGKHSSGAKIKGKHKVWNDETHTFYHFE